MFIEYFEKHDSVQGFADKFSQNLKEAGRGNE